MTTAGREVCGRCELAERPWARMRGLLARRSLPPSEGMLFPGVSSVHTFGMRFPLDVVFLDDRQQVLSVHAGVRPWRLARHRGAAATLELAAGEAGRVGLEPGLRLEREGRACPPQS